MRKSIFYTISAILITIVTISCISSIYFIAGAVSISNTTTILQDNDSASKTEVFTASGFSIYYTGSNRFHTVGQTVDFYIYIDNMDDSNIMSIRVTVTDSSIYITTKSYGGKINVQLQAGAQYKVRVQKLGDDGLEGSIYQMNDAFADYFQNLSSVSFVTSLVFSIFVLLGSLIGLTVLLKVAELEAPPTQAELERRKREKEERRKEKESLGGTSKKLLVVGLASVGTGLFLILGMTNILMPVLLIPDPILPGSFYLNAQGVVLMNTLVILGILAIIAGGLVSAYWYLKKYRNQ